uniref:transposase family protein n=1 Tax=Gordonia oryzae TaxID=2487349 RepID=UPI003F82B1FA
MSSVVQKVLSIPAVVEGVAVEETTAAGVRLVVEVRGYARDRSRCGECGRRCPGYDQVSDVRRWRHLDVAGRQCWLVGGDRPRSARHPVLGPVSPHPMAGDMVDKVRRRTVATHGGRKGAMWAVRKTHTDQSPEQRGIVE